MKIGLVIYGSLDSVSGGYLYDRRLVLSLREQGHEVRIISLPRRNYPAHLTDNLQFRLPPGLDLLIQDELNHPSLLAANASSHPYPLISLVHHLRSSEDFPGWQKTFYRFIERAYLRSVDGFIFSSKTTRAAVQSLAGNNRPALIAYPPTDRFGTGLSEPLVAARAERSTPLRLLFLGNLIPRKGLVTLMAAIRRQPSAFSLDIVGSLTADPAHARKIQNLASGLPTLIQFHGLLEDGQLIEKLKQAHVLVVPSSYEGYGIVYLEGMAFGLPAIGTTGGAASEIITDGETGYLVPPGDAATLAARLAALAADRDLLRWMSFKALERYRSQPAWEQTAKDIRAFLSAEYCVNI
jgi:glycosyltransferase involved in cell wall biosynthesis